VKRTNGEEIGELVFDSSKVHSEDTKHKYNLVAGRTRLSLYTRRKFSTYHYSLTGKESPVVAHQILQFGYTVGRWELPGVGFPERKTGPNVQRQPFCSLIDVVAEKNQLSSFRYYFYSTQ